MEGVDDAQHDSMEEEKEDGCKDIKETKAGWGVMEAVKKGRVEECKDIWPSNWKPAHRNRSWNYSSVKNAAAAFCKNKNGELKKMPWNAVRRKSTETEREQGPTGDVRWRAAASQLTAFVPFCIQSCKTLRMILAEPFQVHNVIMFV